MNYLTEITAANTVVTSSSHPYKSKVTNTGLAIPSDVLNGIVTGTKGVVLVDGRASSTSPLVLVVEKDGLQVVEFPLRLSLSGVEDMFRHRNLNHVASGGESTVDSRLDAPNSPDQMSNGKNFVFLHGYNVNQQQARGWQAEMFKRMWWAGSKAKFHAVSWYAYETQLYIGISYNLQTNIVHAFETAPALANFLNSLSGETVVAGHSLGNMLASATITLNSGTAAKYFVIDGAVAMEAFKPSQAKPIGMINNEWMDYYFSTGGEVL